MATRHTLYGAMALLFAVGSTHMLARCATYPSSDDEPAGTRSMLRNMDASHVLRVFCVLQGIEEKGVPETRVIACVLNAGEQPVRIYVPGFSGPEIWKKGAIHYEPLAFRDTPFSGRLADFDFVLLRPHSMYAKELVCSMPVSDFADSYKATCSYTVYKEGAEGKPAGIQALIRPDGDEKDHPFRERAASQSNTSLPAEPMTQPVKPEGSSRASKRAAASPQEEEARESSGTPLIKP